MWPKRLLVLAGGTAAAEDPVSSSSTATIESGIFTERASDAGSASMVFWSKGAGGRLTLSRKRPPLSPVTNGSNPACSADESIFSNEDAGSVESTSPPPREW
jgi:hypothetical protein